MRLSQGVLLFTAAFWGIGIPFAMAAPAGQPRLAANRRAPAKHGKDVTTMYRDAMALYNKGQYPIAAQAFGRILQRYPGHDPSRLQLAKTLYRLDRPRDAYLIFKPMDPQFLDAETSYEYAQSHLQQNDLEHALVAFKRVPKDHALHDLAAYYGAITAFRLKRYQEAEDLIDDAVVLPSKLTKSRNLYKKNISELRAREQEENLSREKAQEIQRMKTETKTYNDTLGKERKDRSRPGIEARPDEPAYLGFQELGTEARAGGETKSLTVDQGDADEKLLINRAFFHFITTPHLRLGKPATLPAAVGARLDLRLEDHYFEGRETVVHADNDELATSYLYEDKSGNDKFGKARAALWGEAPMGPVLGGFEAAYYLAARDFKTKTSVNNISGQAFVGAKTQVWQWRALGNFVQTQVDKKPLKTTTGVKVEGEGHVHEAVALYGNLYQRQYHYDDTALPGPDNTFEGVAGIKAFLPWQIQLGAEMGYFLDKDYRVPGVDPGNDVVFDANTIYSRVYIDAKPFTWLGLQAHGARADRQLTHYSTTLQDVIAATEKAQYHLLSEFVVMAYVNLLF